MRKNVFVFLLLIFFTNLTMAQGISDSLQVDLKALDVHAQKTTLLSGSARLLQLISRSEIETMPVQSVDQLLENISGVDIRNRGVGGTQSDISIRGGSFDQVLVLLNGINITDPQTGHYNLDIPVELSDIERIELLQGSAARMYGPNAFSGAINIVTANKPGNRLSAMLSAGSYHTYSQNISGTLGKRNFSTFNSISNKFSAGYIPNTDFKNINAFSHSVLKTESAGKFDLQMGFQQKAFGANAFYSFKYPLQFDFTKTYFGSINWDFHRKMYDISSQMYFRRHYDRFELYRDSISTKPGWYTGHNYHLTDVSGGKISAVIRLPFALTTLGVDVRNEHIYSNQLGMLMASKVKNAFDSRQDFTKDDNRLFKNAFVDMSKSLGKFYFSVGTSFSDSKQFGTVWFGGANAMCLFNENFRVYTSVNNAVNLPTFTDLYLTNSIQKGNINLLPGKSTTIEAGTKFSKNKLVISGLAFYRLGKNVIDWVKYPQNSYWQSINHAELNAFGMDLSAAYTFSNSFLKQINVSYSYIKMNNEALNFDSKYAFDYLRNKIVLNVNHKLMDGLTAQWSASYNDRAGNYVLVDNQPAIDYEPFFMLNVRLNWSIKYMDVFADVNNILNSIYADFGGLPLPGINFNAGVRFKIN